MTDRSVFTRIETLDVPSKAAREAEIGRLGLDLQRFQRELEKTGNSVLIVIAGEDAVGANRLLNLLHRHMDPRFLAVRAYGRPTAEERRRPLFWRYWRKLPPRGRVGVFVSGWTQRIIERRLAGKIDSADAARWIEHILAFERQLIGDGALLLKFWLHVTPDEYKKRLGSRRPVLGRRSTARQQKLLGDRDRVLDIAGQILLATDREEPSWKIVDASRPRQRELTVLRSVHGAIGALLKAKQVAAPAGERPDSGSVEPVDHLGAVDLGVRLEEEAYGPRLKRWQLKLQKSFLRVQRKNRSVVLAFEGWDAAGKGGVIRRIASSLDAALYEIVPIAAPTDEERARPYLWRFWRQIPRDGRLTIFDRTWYGRVLVERVEQLATPAEWGRAYDEINDFEAQLAEHGTIVLKFWMHIDPDEQLRRFKQREETPAKRYKVTDDDYRNRDRWDDYYAAVNEMVSRTHRSHAPWHIVPANNKRWARVHVMRTVARTLRQRT